MKIFLLPLLLEQKRKEQEFHLVFQEKKREGSQHFPPKSLPTKRDPTTSTMSAQTHASTKRQLDLEWLPSMVNLEYDSPVRNSRAPCPVPLAAVSLLHLTSLKRR